MLARQALEQAIDRLWEQRAPGVLGASMRVQLSCLRIEVDPAVAADAAFAWHALSRATHHHAYELDPTREELATLVEEVERVCEGLAVD